MTKTIETAGLPTHPKPDAAVGEGQTEPRAAPGPVEAQPAPHLLRESLQWWTPAALAWGTPVKMWATIVATVWQPFLPPTALTGGQRPVAPAATPPGARSSPAEPAAVPGTRPRQR